MSDLQTPSAVPAATPAPAAEPQPSSVPAGGLSVEEVASMRSYWIGLGLDPARFDAAAAGGSPAPPGTPAPGAPEPPAADPFSGVEVVNGLKTPPISQAQALEMADALAAAGVPIEQIEAALKADGITDAAYVEDERSEDEIGFDAAFGPEHPDPSSYRVDYRAAGVRNMDPATIAQANAEFTTLASELGLEQSVGEFVIERVVGVGQRFANSSPAERELYQREQDALFLRVSGGPEKAQTRNDLIAKAIAGLPLTQPVQNALEALAKSGALYDAQVRANLALSLERRQHRASLGRVDHE